VRYKQVDVRTTLRQFNLELYRWWVFLILNVDLIELNNIEVAYLVVAIEIVEAECKFAQVDVLLLDTRCHLLTQAAVNFEV
jgi:hypothetical protein